MKEIKIKKISTKRVENLPVYNIELESNTPEGSGKDDLCYTDIESGLIHHNCLRKDFGMINEHFPQTDLLLQAYKINEYLPKLCVDSVSGLIKNKTVGILGYTFKKDADDTRDTLVTKLISYINRETPSKILINDVILKLGKFNDTMNNYIFDNIEYKKVIKNSDIIFIGTNHSMYYKISKNMFIGKIVIDPWRVLEGSLVNDYREIEKTTNSFDMNTNLIEIK